MSDPTTEMRNEGQEADQIASETFSGKPVKWYATNKFQPPTDAENRQDATKNDKGSM